MDLTLYEMPGLAIITILVMGLAIWLVLKLRQRRAWVPNLDGKHVLITGGSSGIGKSVALAAARFGADVSIVSRDSMKLFEAGQEIMEVRKNDNQLVTCMVGDVSDSIKLERALIVIMDKVEKEIDILVTCAGFAICGTFEEVPTKDVNNMIQTNLIGTMNALRLVIPMMKARKSGNIVLVGSQASLIGLYGYSAYACTKFAIRGLAESLQMEMKPFNIQVTLCLPPDTDTPGFEAENDSKPEITKKISSAGGLVDPDTVANTLLKDTLRGNFFSTVGFSSHLLTGLCVGMAPVNNPLKLVWECCTLGLFRLIGIAYLCYFNFIISRNVKKTKEAKDK